jgi:hypothetical protein
MIRGCHLNTEQYKRLEAAAQCRGHVLQNHPHIIRGCHLYTEEYKRLEAALSVEVTSSRITRT